jgi:hypothetical protein
MADTVSLLSTYFPLVESQMPPGFRQEQEALALQLRLESRSRERWKL